MSELCLTVIAKDEARVIRRCLESARHHVDRMIVLDTGSSDETGAIASVCGAEVYQWEWTGSFSDARNRSMEIANSPWCLVLDADEWVDSSASRDSLNLHMGSTQSAGSILIRNIVDIEGRREIAETRVPRLFTGKTRYRGRIHEQPVTLSSDVNLDFLVHHDGYTAQRAALKRSRNFELLRDALKEDPLSAYLHFQLAVQYETIEDWSNTLASLLKALELGGDSRSFSHSLAYRLMHAFSRCGRLTEGLQAGQHYCQLWPDSSDIHFAFGNLCLDAAVADPQNAASVWLPAAEAAWLKCLAIGDVSNYAAHVVGRGGHLAAHNLAVLYEGVGDADRARQLRMHAEQLSALTG